MSPMWITWGMITRSLGSPFDGTVDICIWDRLVIIRESTCTEYFGEWILTCK